MPRLHTKPVLLTLATLALPSLPASATWSILIADTRTGEIVLASATCLTGFDLAVETPVLLTGIGAITAQSSVDSTGRNRMLVRDRLLEGHPLSDILDELSTYDPGHSNRQYGMITATGQTLTYSGIDNADWAGGITGRIEQGRPGPDDDIVYTVQGNILSGPNVVQAAVDAIINTDTDLPGKLMSAMLAARLAGGDGRCSCSPSAPTSCGSPPPPPFKSAHVGYMIGARADDTDSIRAFYELPAPSTALTQLDTNTFATSDTANNIHLYTNATNPEDQTAHFNFKQTIETNLPNLTNLTAADLDNNGLKDLITLTTPTTIAIFKQSTPATFEPPILVPLSHPITDIEPINIQSLPGQQLALTFPTLGSFSIVNLNNQTLQTIQEFINEGDNQAATATDLNNDSIQDIILLDTQGQEIRYIFLDNEANILTNLSANTSADPKQVRTADINNDGLTDIIVATGSSRLLNAFLNTGTPETPAFTQPINSPIAAPAIDLQITDLNNDGIQDTIVLLTTGSNLRYYLGDNEGHFTETDRTRLGGTPTNALLADLNNDGDMDLITNASSNLLIYDNLNDATLQRQTGFARGNKFMFINIFNQNAADEDPVDQMLTEFAAFRDSLTNKVDAVQSTTAVPLRVLIDDPHNDAATAPSIRIELRDWQSNLLTDPATFTLTHDPDHLTPLESIQVAPGIYDIPITALSANNAHPGTHTLTIKATTATSAVTLMPSLTLRTTTSLADYNADNAHDFFDIALFVAALSNQDPAADLNHDAKFNAADINLFISAYQSNP